MFRMKGLSWSDKNQRINGKRVNPPADPTFWIDLLKKTIFWNSFGNLRKRSSILTLQGAKSDRWRHPMDLSFLFLFFSDDSQIYQYLIRFFSNPQGFDYWTWPKSLRPVWKLLYVWNRVNLMTFYLEQCDFILLFYKCIVGHLYVHFYWKIKLML